jgi:hypothetical protein
LLANVWRGLDEMRRIFTLKNVTRIVLPSNKRSSVRREVRTQRLASKRQSGANASAPAKSKIRGKDGLFRSATLMERQTSAASLRR